MGPYTLRELVRMVETRQRIMWDHTAMLVATILNSRQGVTRKDMIRNPSKLNPYRQRVLTPQRSKMTIAQFARGFGK